MKNFPLFVSQITFIVQNMCVAKSASSELIVYLL